MKIIVWGGGNSKHLETLLLIAQFQQREILNKLILVNSFNSKISNESKFDSCIRLESLRGEVCHDPALLYYSAINSIKLHHFDFGTK